VTLSTLASRDWGGVYRGGEKSSNLLINGENYYVLQSLLYAFEEKVDAIYIDPAYNTGARD
jgi:adenine-specific DNA-methyltransferase